MSGAAPTAGGPGTTPGGIRPGTGPSIPGTGTGTAPGPGATTPRGANPFNPGGTPTGGTRPSTSIPIEGTLEASPNAEFEVIHLKLTDAETVVQVISEVFNGKGEKRVSVVADKRVNAVILIRGSKDDLKRIRELVSKMDTKKYAEQGKWGRTHWRAERREPPGGESNHPAAHAARLARSLQQPV